MNRDEFLALDRKILTTIVRNTAAAVWATMSDDQRTLVRCPGPRSSKALIRSQPHSGLSCLSIRMARFVTSGSRLPLGPPRGFSQAGSPTRQKALLESHADEQELERNGGREAVIASIRRHLPTFDPGEAQEVYGPAWTNLKPILVRAGLNPVDETTTLTDIKAFLDATEPLYVLKEPIVPSTRNVFVIHGRNGPARDAMFDFLRALGLNPLEWGQVVKLTGKGSPYIGEVLDTAFSNAQTVVVVLTGDDLARLRADLLDSHDPDYERNLTPQARPNVLFEAGMAFGRHADRTIMVQIGSVRPFSDVAGKHAVHFQGSAPQRAELRERLKTAGCAVADGGTDWLKAGNFDEALKLATPKTS